MLGMVLVISLRIGDSVLAYKLEVRIQKFVEKGSCIPT